MSFSPLGFGLAWDPLLLSSFLLLPFGMGVSILCPSHYVFHILETHNLSGFTGSQLDSNLPRDESYLASHPYLI